MACASYTRHDILHGYPDLIHTHGTPNLGGHTVRVELRLDLSTLEH